MRLIGQFEAISLAILWISLGMSLASPIASTEATENPNSVNKEPTTTALETSTAPVPTAEAPKSVSTVAPTAEASKPCTCPPATAGPKTESPETTHHEPKPAELQHSQGPVISKTGFIYAFSGFLGIGIIFYGVRAYCARKRQEDRQI